MNNVFCENLKYLREKKGLNQKQIALIFNTTQQTISRWESGTNQPDYDTLLKIAKYFNKTIDYLLGNTSTPQNDLTEIQELYDKLSDTSKARLLGSAEGLLLAEQQFLSNIPYGQKQIKGNKNHG